MTSQLNVDTIVDKAGSGGSNVKMANTSTYVSDGGAVTQNTVQGLIKAWWTYDQGTTTLEDSYNIASLTDNGTGNHTGTYTNAMAATTYAVSGVTESNGIIQVYSDGTKVAASLRMQTGDGLGSSGVVDYDECSVMISGDLA